MSAEIEHFVALERKVWQALIDGDPAADAALLTDDFLGVYPTGFSDRAEHAAQLDEGPSVLTYELADLRLFEISDDAVMLAYRATYIRANTPATSETMYVSSLWCLRGDTWLNVFSQDTPTNDVGY